MMERHQILQSIIKNLPIDESTPLDLLDIAQKAVGFVAADLSALIRSASEIALNRYLSSLSTDLSTPVLTHLPCPHLSRQDILTALQLTPASSLRAAGAVDFHSAPTSNIIDPWN
jgi:SpoVK/Ycf46/Vps4 family AAA+-type ATPase